MSIGGLRGFIVIWLIVVANMQRIKDCLVTSEKRGLLCFSLVLFLVVANMLRVPPGVYYTPLYLAFLFSILSKNAFLNAKALFSVSPFFLLYILLGLFSIVYSHHYGLTFSSVRNDLLTPVLALFTSFSIVSCCKYQGLQRRLGWSAAVLLLCIATVSSFFSSEWIFKVFDTQGYYSSYIVMVAAATIPYLTGKNRWLFYILFVYLLSLSPQRVVWVFVPLIVIADLYVNKVRLLEKRSVFLVLAVLCIGIFGYQQEAKKHPVDAHNPSVKADGVVDAMLKNERIHVWQEWLKRANNNWLFGTGYGRETALATLSETESWDESKLFHAHNILLNNYVQLGAVGLIIFVISQLQILLWARKTWNLKSSQAVFLLCLFFLLRNQFDDFSFKRVLIVYALIMGYFIGQTFLQIRKNNSTHDNALLQLPS